MDLLIDVNIILDVCAERHPHAELSAAALQHCLNQGGKLWLYAGSVQTMEYNLYQELRREVIEESGLSRHQLFYKIRAVLREFASDKNWLAALAGEGDVFYAHDPEDEQMIRALDRFTSGNVKLLTRDEPLLERYPEKTISPARYCQTTKDSRTVPFVDLATQQDAIRPALEKNLHTVMHHGKYIMGPEVGQLESRLADFVKAKHCIACSSGTDALLMTLMACNIGPGDAVFTSPFTFIATAEVIALLGATPIFVDIDPATFNIDPDQLEKAVQAVQKNDPSLYPLPSEQPFNPITSKAKGNSPLTDRRPLTAKAVIPVDLFGLPCDYDRINTIAKRHDMFVVEDAAQSLGAQYRGRMAGSLGHMGCISFFPAKPLGCYGDGGAVLTDDDNLAQELTSIRVHGKGTHKYDNARIGVNGRLDTMQAAVLLAKLDTFPQEIKLRQEAAKRYTDLLTQTPNSQFQTPSVPQGYKSAWAQYSLLAKDNEQRQDFQDRLKKQGIPSVVYYPKPLHEQSAFADLGYGPNDMPVSHDCASRIFSLPMHPYIARDDQEYIANVLKAD